MDDEGVHEDPAASKDSCWVRIIYKIKYSDVEPKDDSKDACVRKEMGKCSDFRFIKSNCCDCARKALSSCGLKKKGGWPNFEY